MYHIFVVVALIASQNKIDSAKKYYQERISQKENNQKDNKSNIVQDIKPTSKTGTIPLIPNYPLQPNNTDIIDQFKKESSQDKEVLNKLAKADIEALGLDPLDNNKSSTPTNSSPSNIIIKQTPKPNDSISLAANKNSTQTTNQKTANPNSDISTIPSFSNTTTSNFDDKNKNIETDITDDSKKLDEQIKQNLARFDDSQNPLTPTIITKKSDNQTPNTAVVIDKKDNPSITPANPITPSNPNNNTKDKITTNPIPETDIKNIQEKDLDKLKPSIAPSKSKESPEESLQKSLNKLQLELAKRNNDKDSKKSDKADDKSTSKNLMTDQKQDQKTEHATTAAKEEALSSENKKSDSTTKDQTKEVVPTKPDIITEKKLTAAEIKEERKLKKLNKLREKYLAQIEEDEDEWNNEEEMDEYHKLTKIIPQKKTPPKFVNYTVPPQLAVPYRSPDNLHLPIIINYGQKVELMFRAISENNLEAFNALFKSINKANIKNSYGDTALTFAILTQRHPIIVSALSQGANPDMKNDLCYTPLNIAIEILDYKTVGILLDMNANPNLVDESGRTYLMEAIKVGSLPIVDLLISKGVDINAKDKFGYTALDIAYRYRKDIIAKYLKKHGGEQAIVEYETDKESLIEELKNRWE